MSLVLLAALLTPSNSDLDAKTAIVLALAAKAPQQQVFTVKPPVTEVSVNADMTGWVHFKTEVDTDGKSWKYFRRVPSAPTIQHSPFEAPLPLPTFQPQPLWFRGGVQYGTGGSGRGACFGGG